MVYERCGFSELTWKGQGVEAKLVGVHPITKKQQVLVTIDPQLFRPGEVPFLQGDYSKIRQELQWKPKTNWQQLAAEMVDYEMQRQALTSFNRR